MDPPFEISHRYLQQSSGQPCTLRYVGPVATQASTDSEQERIWLGVEWDDSSRGKHSGDHLGKAYFKTRTEGAASFLKWKVQDRPKPLCGPGLGKEGEMLWRGRTLLESIKNRYLDQDTLSLEHPREESVDPRLTLGSSNSRIQVSVPNLDKVTSKFADLGKLTHLGLDGMWIYGVGQADVDRVQRFESVKTLDLSKNLISRWEDLAEILRSCPSLRSLKISQSRMPELSESLALTLGADFPDIIELTMRESLLSWSDVVHLATAFPNLQKLDIAVNPLSTKKPERTTSPGLSKVSELVVGDCGIFAWDDVVEMFGWMPSLTTLDLSVNPIGTISPKIETARNAFPNLQHIVLKESTLSAWQDMTHLATWMNRPDGSLKSLKVTLGPDQPANGPNLTSPRMAGTRSDRPGLIARFPDLEELNSSPITPAEREEAARIARTLQDSGKLIEQDRDVAPTMDKPAGNSLKSKMIDLKLTVSADFPSDSAVEVVSILPSATLKILMIKLRKTLNIQSKADLEIFHDGNTYGASENSRKLADLGLKGGDEIVVRLTT